MFNANHRLFTFIVFTFRRRTSKRTIDISAVVWYNIENVLGVEVMTFLEMYLNISKKFGQDSPQMNKFKEYFMQYKDKPHIVRKIYQSIMGEL